MVRKILIDSMKLFAPLGVITSRSMFGGFGLFSDQVIFAFVQGENLHIRADSYSKKEFEAKLNTKKDIKFIIKVF